jgi:hypothetical protein
VFYTSSRSFGGEINQIRESAKEFPSCWIKCAF